MQTIFEILLTLLNRGEDSVLATVASAQGSTPRGAGAQLLAGREGLISGTIGGGPGEAQALVLAAECLEKRRSNLRRLELRHGGELDSVCGESRRSSSSSSPETAPPGKLWPRRPWSAWRPAGGAGWSWRRRGTPPSWRREAPPGTGRGWSSPCRWGNGW